MQKSSKCMGHALMITVILAFTCLPVSSTHAACPDDMFAYWKLDEPTPDAPNGTYADFIKGNDGKGSVNPTAAIGIINGAQAFNGIDTRINVPADNSFDWQSNESFSIEFWMKTDGVAPVDDQAIIGRDDVPATGLNWWIGIDGTNSPAGTAGHVSFILRETNGSGGILSGVGSISLSDGSWHHVVAVRDESTKVNIIYVDGTEQGRVSHDYGAGFGSATAALNIGWLLSNSVSHFDGMIDEIALYDRALSPVEIQEHRDAGLSGIDYCSGVAPFVPFPDDTISLWQLDESALGAINGTYTDAFNGNNGTGNVNPTAAAGIVDGAQAFSSGDKTQINVPADKSFNWQYDESFSIEFWAKINTGTPSTDQVIIGRNDLPETGLNWWIGVEGIDGTPGNVSFVLREKNGFGRELSGVGNISLTDGSWHHVVAVRDESTNDNIVYVDGIEQGRENFNYVTGFDSARASLNIGWLDTGTGLYFDGLLDEVALYDRALPLTEIQEHHDAGRLGNGIETLRPVPIADAGPDQTVSEAAVVTLNGSNSSDGDGAIISHLWEQTAGTAVTLSNASTDTATFTTPDVAAAGETLTFQLTVTDDDGQASADTTSVTVNDNTIIDGGGGGGCFISSMFQW